MSPEYDASALERDGFLLSSDHARIDLDVVHQWLAVQSYWAKGRGADTVRSSFEHSQPFCVYRDGRQVACSRVVTDRATFAWVCDVFVDEPWRARGIGRWMVSEAVAWCTSMGIQRVVLATRDAHGVYETLGFQPLASPERWMMIDTR